MKAKVIIGIILIGISIFVGSRLLEFNKYKIGIVYSGNAVVGHVEENTSKDYLTREEAIKKAEDIVTNVLGDNIDINTASEYVSLKSDGENLVWNIELVSNKNTNYLIDILADKGYVTFVEKADSGYKEYNNYHKGATREELEEGVSIIQECKDKLGLDLELKKIPKYYYVNNNKDLKIIYELKDSNIEFVIDLKAKKLLKYSVSDAVSITIHSKDTISNKNISSKNK